MERGRLKSNYPSSVHRRVRGLHYLTLVFLSTIGLAVAYWTIVRSPSLYLRDDNPRQLEVEYRVRRGQIIDKNGMVLAQTLGPIDRLRRTYPLVEVAPVVGYYSLIHGTSGIEESYDLFLSGSRTGFWQSYWNSDLLHKPHAGSDVQLTISGGLQKAASKALANRSGAVLIISLPANTIVAMSSGPSFDPNVLDEQFEELMNDESAPLLNRVTQGQYQPGMLLQPIILSKALERKIIRIEDIVKGTNNGIAVNGLTLSCRIEPPANATWADVMASTCPAPMVELAALIGSKGMSEIFASYKLYEPADLPIPTEASPSRQIEDLGMAAIGQDMLVVSPLQMALAIASIANNGWMKQARLTEAIQDENGKWRQTAEENNPQRVVASSAANAIYDAIPTVNQVSELKIEAVSGPGGRVNSWYVGIGPTDEPMFIVVVVIEDSTDAMAAEQIGRDLLKMALEEK